MRQEPVSERRDGAAGTAENGQEGETMDVGIGLPNAVPGTEGPALVDWARRAEEAGFSTLGTIGRLVYPNYDDLIALAAAAAVTTRIRLTSAILIAPLHLNTALLAKQAASIDRLSGGRLVLGAATGGRDDDYSASGTTTKGRGRRLDEQLQEMRRIWSGEKGGYTRAIGPAPARSGGPEIIVGGMAGAAFTRAARFGDGWMMGGGTPEMFAQGAQAVEQAWQAEGRSGRPRKLSLAYFALGELAREQADRYINDYYGWLGDFASQIAAGAATSAEMVRGYVSAFGQAGCDELIMCPTSSDPEQVNLLAEALR
jgi:alkanesulfonate monooxygenase SsuD/methylene tetrahydromethanopterin reductase-like flavin-dependent oxidoreductase (luciferase family)